MSNTPQHSYLSNRTALTIDVIRTLTTHCSGANDLAHIVHALLETSATVQSLLSSSLHTEQVSHTKNVHGELQKPLDLIANDLFLKAVESFPINTIISEELVEPKCIQPNAHLNLAFDPIDGSSNLDTNTTVGTLFVIWSSQGKGKHAFPKRSTIQCSGFISYGPTLSLWLTFGKGVSHYQYSTEHKVFLLDREHVRLHTFYPEYALNTSYRKYWSPQIQSLAKAFEDGQNGTFEHDYTMRWVGSLVADAERILHRGGVFCYPANSKPGYENGRLRSVYEAVPIAYLIEQAGGASTDGFIPILEQPIKHPHQKTPLFFGSPQNMSVLQNLLQNNL